MRSLERNKVSFYYAISLGVEDIKDEFDNYTGESTPIYSEPKLCKSNITTIFGKDDGIDDEEFGNEVRYDKVILTTDKNIPFKEGDVLWIDIKPDGNFKNLPDYKVVKIITSINNLRIGVRRII